MSDTLLVEANKMKAKDERFISQGVYNLLYGTVELLIVSAEASRVTGDSDTVSANRSKVGVYIHLVWHNGCTVDTEERFFKLVIIIWQGVYTEKDVSGGLLALCFLSFHQRESEVDSISV